MSTFALGHFCQLHRLAKSPVRPAMKRHCWAGNVASPVNHSLTSIKPIQFTESFIISS